MSFPSDIRIAIDGFGWRPEDLLERLRSPELPLEEFWRCMSYALYVMREDEEYMAALNEVKKNRTATSFPQRGATTPQNEMPEAPPRILSAGNRPPRVFHANLNEREIVSTLLRTDHLGLGPKQFAMTLQEFFLGIGWLVNRIDTQFVAWLKYYQIIDAAANNLQHVSKNKKMDTLKLNLKNTFQFQNTIGEWEDNRNFYSREDSQKINSGIKRK